MNFTRSLWLLGLALALTGQPAAARTPWQDDFLARGRAGEWTGSGVVYGNPVTLTRSWSLDLAGHFLKADMKVSMGQRGSFRALAYWRKTAANQYELTWMDESGNRLNHRGLGDPEKRQVVVVYLGETPGDPPDWRRLVYRVTSDDSYEETMFSQADDGTWSQIAAFQFNRVKP